MLSTHRWHHLNWRSGCASSSTYRFSLSDICRSLSCLWLPWCWSKAISRATSSNSFRSHWLWCWWCCSLCCLGSMAERRWASLKWLSRYLLFWLRNCRLQARARQRSTSPRLSKTSLSCWLLLYDRLSCSCKRWLRIIHPATSKTTSFNHSV